MTRRVPILRRRPRTRRARVLARFELARDDTRRRFRRLRHRQLRRADHARVQKLFLQFGHTRHTPVEPVAAKRHRRSARLWHPKT